VIEHLHDQDLQQAEPALLPQPDLRAAPTRWPGPPSVRRLWPRGVRRRHRRRPRRRRDHHRLPQPGWPGQVRALTGGVDAAVNAAPGGDRDAIAAVRDGGRLVTITRNAPPASRGIETVSVGGAAGITAGPAIASMMLVRLLSLHSAARTARPP
jgi:hypothetical protein